MLDCKRVLEGVQTELHVLEVKDVDPEVVQSHLEKCMVRMLGTVALAEDVLNAGADGRKHTKKKECCLSKEIQKR